jgi:hypothetical protein
VQGFHSLGGYKDGLQPETLADGNWLVKQNQPVSKIETNLTQTGLYSLACLSWALSWAGTHTLAVAAHGGK